MKQVIEERTMDKMMNVNKEELKALIDVVVNKTFQMDLNWDWPLGVAFYGVAKAYETTGDEAYLEKLKSRIDEFLDLERPVWTVNTCAMGHSLITLYEATGDDKYLELIESKIDYLRNDALRFGENVLQHTVSKDNDFPEQAWADTLFMAAYFMLRVGIMKKDEDLINDALNQYYWHIEFLMDKKDDLWYHGYSHVKQSHLSGFYWGRANAWAAYTMSHVRTILPEWYLYPKCMDIECGIRDHLASIKTYQTENGLWRTILNDDSSYEEVSASCGIGAAMLENGNPLHVKYAMKAYEGIKANITDDGKVMNVSAGTAVMRDREGYQSITKSWMQGWGQGLALAMLTALYKSKHV